MLLETALTCCFKRSSVNLSEPANVEGGFFLLLGVFEWLLREFVNGAHQRKVRVKEPAAS